MRGIAVCTAVVGVVVLSLGSATLRENGSGLDPYTAANIGIAHHVGLTLGICQLASNGVLFLIVVLTGRSHLGIGTVLNAVLVGFLVQWWSALLHPVLTSANNDIARLTIFVAAILVFAFGAALYLGAGLGASPYDAIAPVIVDHTGWRYRPVRMIQDILFLLIAIATGGPVGVGTIVTAFFSGPLIDFFTRRLVRPVVDHRSNHARADTATRTGSKA